jgi:3-hydroxyacyl-[acyl-carrier-protein] dehydratase
VDSSQSQAVLMDQQEIQRWIPHRSPFLFVDRVLELGEDQILTEWDLAPDAFFFQGHYPDYPILPGVLVNEHVFQSAAILMSKLDDSRPGEIEGVPVLTRIQEARFKRFVRPGETIQARTILNDRVGRACYLKSTITCDGQKVARLEFVVAQAPTQASTETGAQQ